jgi:hypothetical protein
VTVTARNYAFDAPDTVASGVTTIRLINRGPELHHVQLLRLTGGKTLADLAGAMHGEGPLPEWATPVGGPNAPAPDGGESRAIVSLEPGRYAMVCLIPAPDGVPHVMKGMARELIVVPAKNPSAAPPEPDVTLRLIDYGFSFSRALTPGRHVIRVLNTAAQPHEMFIAKLAPGKTAADLLTWIAKPEGPPPGLPLGGTVGLANGIADELVVDLEPGEYGLYCFLPDAKDGKPHVMHGMMHQLTVPERVADHQR